MDKLREQLYKAITDTFAFPLPASARDMAEAIEAMIDAKITEAVNDLRNEINKTGVYDPDW